MRKIRIYQDGASEREIIAVNFLALKMNLPLSNCFFEDSSRSSRKSPLSDTECHIYVVKSGGTASKYLVPMWDGVYFFRRNEIWNIKLH